MDDNLENFFPFRRAVDKLLAEGIIGITTGLDFGVVGKVVLVEVGFAHLEFGVQYIVTVVSFFFHQI